MGKIKLLAVAAAGIHCQFKSVTSLRDEDAVPKNNPREAVKWISINKPKSVGMAFGGDAGTFLGSQYFNANITYGSGDLNAAAVNQYIRSNKYSNFYSYIDSMRIKL